MSGEVLFSLREVSLRLGTAQILEGVSFDIINRGRPGLTTGQVVGVLGPSGVGKTRLLRIIAGLDAPDHGAVLGIDKQKIRAGDVGVVFQDYPLLRHRTVRSNLEIAGRANGLSTADARDRTRKLLELFHLTDRGAYYPAQLSGGQRQRVAIAQQMVCPKQLLLMDEPFSGLDPAALEDVMHLLVEVANMDDHNTVLIVTHDIRAAMAVSDTMFMLGREQKPDGTFRSGARIQETYDLVERDLAWRRDVMELPAFFALETAIRQRFKQL